MQRIVQVESGANLRDVFRLQPRVAGIDLAGFSRRDMHHRMGHDRNDEQQHEALKQITDDIGPHRHHLPACAVEPEPDVADEHDPTRGHSKTRRMIELSPPVEAVEHIPALDIGNS